MALGLSRPIQLQAIENLKQTGKADTGLISTGLLYVSILTGDGAEIEVEVESLQTGDSVLAGTVLEEGDILIRVDEAGEETRLAAIIRLIETAETIRGFFKLLCRYRTRKRYGVF